VHLFRKGFLQGKLFLFSAFFLWAFLFSAPTVPSPPVPETGVGNFLVGGFAFTVPEGWKRVVPSSPMRKAQLLVPSGENQTNGAEVTFFHFGSGQGGSVPSNVERWERQFSTQTGSPAKATAKKISIHSVPVTLVAANGTFASGMPGGETLPRPGFALRGAILENPGGDVFVKMTGPEGLVQSATQAFDSMIESACKKADLR